MKRDPVRFKRWRLLVTGLWLSITFSLSAWWMIHGMNQSGELGLSEEATRQHRMFFWEGSFLLMLVVLGGAALAYFVYWDQRRYEEVRKFFSTFTHELKTSLTSLRLQAEILEERHSENENLQRLLKDVVRLELQLENALILAQADKGELFLEEISLKKSLQALSVHWPRLRVSVERDARLLADQRALECIFRNLLQNASVHGEASEMSVAAAAAGEGVLLHFRDNGRGFKGDTAALGRMFVRHTTRSGTGLGLYLSKILAKRMHGSLELVGGASGFEARLQIGGRLA
jgi:signal transduction histidine kinase